MVGLGNPGSEYADTRHNAGCWAVDELVSRYGGALRRLRGIQARTAELRISGRRVAVAVLTVYMNESGRAVGPLARHCRIDDLERLVVLHDELDLPVGAMRVKAGGGMAGHRGLKSIRSHLRSSDFTRVRIGIGRPASSSSSGYRRRAGDSEDVNPASSEACNSRAGDSRPSHRVADTGLGGAAGLGEDRARASRYRHGAGAGVVEHVLSRPGRAEMAELARVAARAADAVEFLVGNSLEMTMNRYNSALRPSV